MTAERESLNTNLIIWRTDMTTVRILQIKDIAGTDYAFRGFDSAKFNIEDYELKYTLESDCLDDKEDLDVLETVFHIFNMRIPKDFTGHSLSVSDCLHIERDGKCRLYYCDSFGWELVKEVRA
jgi:hypothetical protein